MSALNILFRTRTVRPQIKFKPKEHQEAAIEKCLDKFKTATRGQLILPCGAGKTYTALWIKEGLPSVKNTLVIVPSLALLRQIKSEWKSQRKNEYRYLCVCSEDNIDNEEKEDVTVAHSYEVDINVTTDSEKIHNFITQDDSEKVIFSTYHSLSAIATAIDGTDFEFDYIFCDEAHKTAGIGKSLFSLVHDNEKIPAKRRLYATATPRIVSATLKKRLEDDLKYAYDMNDPLIFGEEFYRMTFKEAIDQKILVDYKIVVIGIGDSKLQEDIRTRKWVSEKYTIDDIANSFALNQVMTNYGASHAITFHSRVKTAKDFAERHSYMFEDICCKAVSGKQPTSERNIILNEFKSAEKAIVSNARCLTEGVDVPAIDLVYFCDPKNSKIDIVQAAGRALRTKEGKTQGLIVVPIYHLESSNVEKVIPDSSFKNLIQVIRALCDQDERLHDEICSATRGKGNRRIDIVNISLAEETNKVILEGFEPKLKESLFTQIIEKSSDIWTVWYHKLKAYLDENNSTWPTKDKDEGLYYWITAQRTAKNKNKLSTYKIKRLYDLDFVWEIVDHKWAKSFEDLIIFRKETNYERWPTYDKKHTATRESKLGVFCQQMRERYRKNALSEYWLEELISINFNFEGTKDNWEVRFGEIKTMLDKGEVVSQSTEYGWIFLQKKRCENGALSQKQAQMIESLNLGRFFESWDSKFERLERWVTDNEKLPTPKTQKDFTIWLTSQRSTFNKGNLSAEQVNKLESIGFNLYANEKRIELWNQKYEQLKKFIRDNDNQWPKRTLKGEESTLYNWCQDQRQTQQGTKKNRKPLEQWKIDMLNEIDFAWSSDIISAKKETWETNYQQLKELSKEDVNNLTFTDGIGQWLYNQIALFSKGNYSENREAKFLKIGIDLNSFDMTVRDGRWENKYQQLKELSKEEVGNLSSTDGIAKWLYRQITLFSKGNYSDDRVRRLLEIGIDLDSLYNKRRKKSQNK